MSKKLGFMQGRLVKDEKNLIQSFPTKNWIKEFSIANQLGLKKMEWTIDRKNILKNPLFNKDQIIKIKKLSKTNDLKIESVTCDFFMQRPFFKIKNKEKMSIEISLLKSLIKLSKKIGIKYFILPLVDNSSINNKKEEQVLIKELIKVSKILKNNKQKILFEIDYPPIKLKNFIKKFSPAVFGINYDLGNSASNGYDLKDEIDYFKYVNNVHIKDRKLNGHTVPLGKGHANFDFFFKNMKKINYKGNFILQTARGKNDISEIKKNLIFLKKFNFFN